MGWPNVILILGTFFLTVVGRGSLGRVRNGKLGAGRGDAVGTPGGRCRHVPQGPRGRPPPDAPARRASALTEGLLARGSRPVTAFPEIIPVALWHELAAYSCGGSCGIGTTIPHRIPYSLFLAKRPSIPGQ